MIAIKLFHSTIEISSDFISKNPFQSSWYFDIYSKHFCTVTNILLLGFYNDETYIGYAGFERIGDKAVFLGMKPIVNEQEVTDYGDIVLDLEYRHLYKEIWDKLMDWLLQNGIVSLQLDYVREDSLTYKYFKDKALEQAIAPYISLPKTWDEYLLSLDRVDRKELKRKIKRLDTVTHNYICLERQGENDFEEFVRLHKLSSGEKDEFMSKEMERFFWDLLSVEKKDWRVTLCFLKIEEKNAASLISFENESTIFGYNSGYNPAFNYYSIGLLLHACKIKEAIEKKKTIYDFMRGGERYKYDLGGKDTKLYKIEIPLQK